MRTIIPIFAMIIAPLLSWSQTLEYSEIHWGLSDTISKQLHIKDILFFEGVSQEELRDRTDRWLNMQLTKDQIIEWGTLTGQVGHDWWIAEGEPYDVDGLHRIWTKYMMCKDCVKQFKKSKTGSAAFYRIDFRFKEGKMLMVMSSFYSWSFKMSLDNWMVNKNGLTMDENDSRTISLIDEFNETKNDLKQYIIDCDSPESIDQW